MSLGTMRTVTRLGHLLHHIVLLVCVLGQSTSGVIESDVSAVRLTGGVQASQLVGTSDLDQRNIGKGSVRLAHGVHEQAEHLDYLREALEAAGITFELSIHLVP